MMECRLDGRVALITGGSRGLGRGESRHCRAAPRCAAGGRAGHHGGLGWRHQGLPGDVGKAADC